MRTATATLWGLACIAVPAGCALPPAASLAARDVPRYTIEDFLDTTSLVGASFSPDERSILVSSDASGVYNAYAIPVAGGEPVPLTRSGGDAVFARSYFPRDERFVYESDRGGDELTHVYVREVDGGVTDLTPGEGLKARFLGWAHDRQSMFLSTNERDRRYFDLYDVAVDGYGRELVFRNDEGYQLGPISRDKRFVALVKPRTRTDTDVYLLDRDAGDVSHLTPHEGEVYFSPQAFSPDGTSLYLVTDEGDEFRYLVRLDLGSGRRQVLLKPGWDVWYAELSHGGTYLVVGINNDARTEIRLFEAGTMHRVELPELPAGDIVSVEIARSERTLAFYLNGDRSPSNLYVYDLPSGRVTRLTETLNPRVNAEDLVDGRVVRFRSFDGVEIPGLLYRPHQAEAGVKVPAIVWVHGGPGGQSRVGYSALRQYLVNHGYAVFAVNNRGSTGYGRTFYLMDDRKHGSADLDDCVASKRFLVDQGYVDPQRIGIAGGSYGGYMVLAALAFRPEAFAAGVDLFGVANWIRTLESIPPWWESMREALYKELGDPAEDREHLYAISPLFHASSIRRPLLVLQGANDPRVLKVESDEIVAAARANGAEVEYIVFDDEGHGFRKKANRLAGYRAILDFCNRHLKKGSDPILSR